MHSLMVIFINLNMEFKNKALGRWLHLRVEISCLNTGDFLGRERKQKTMPMHWLLACNVWHHSGTLLMQVPLTSRNVNQIISFL